MPKGFFPQQDTGRMIGGIQADQSISFQLMQQKLTQFVTIVRGPGGRHVVGFTGGGQTNSGFMFVSLKPLSQRKHLGGRRDRAAAAQAGGGPGRHPVPAGGAGYPRRRPRQQRAIPVHAAGADSLEDLNDWAPKIAAALQQQTSVLADVNTDQQNKGLETDLVIDRDAAARLGITVSQIDNTLYDAFGQRQVSTI